MTPAEARELTILCEDLDAEPDFVPRHHASEETLRECVDEELGVISRACGCEESSYPYFVCAHCARLVPWCFGAAHEDEFLAECCDDCCCELEGRAA